ncbi:hypothetical protein [Brevibacterium sp. Marseille-P9724]|uniref:hypothetical protein n=1 Tax=Brevibacterium sp. Marseille-P9724 TaxID=2614125 RepID=UPI00125F4A67|nr:hypothetical protein [Brevibacterium sp. Marseille-P9724]
MSKPTPEEGSNSSSSPQPNYGTGRPPEQPTPPSSPANGYGPQAPQRAPQSGTPAPKPAAEPPMGNPPGGEDAKTTVLPPAGAQDPAQAPRQESPQQPQTSPQGPPQAGQHSARPASAPRGPADGNTAVIPPVSPSAGSAGAFGAGAAAGAGAAGAGRMTPPPGPGMGTPAGGGGTAIAAAPVRERPRKKSNTAAWLIPVIAASVVVILVIVGAIAHFIINRTVYGPDATAEKFVEALNEGDFEKARSYASFDTPENAYTDLIDDPKYAKAAADTLSNAQVTASERNGDDVKITVGYKQGEEDKSIDLTGSKDGKQGLFFDKWKLNAPDLGTVKINAPAGAKVKINGEDFTTSNPDTEYAVLPGTYEISTEGSKFIESASAKTTVGFGGDDGGAELKVDPKPTGELGKEVQKQVDKRIDDCKKAKEFEKKGCGPISLPKKAQNTSIKPEKDVKLNTVSWKVTNPKVSAKLDSGSGKGTFRTTDNGKAQFSADSKSRGKNAWKLATPAPVIASGEFEIDGDSIKITEIYGW